jgi:hypothetical protein
MGSREGSFQKSTIWVKQMLRNREKNALRRGSKVGSITAAIM